MLPCVVGNLLARRRSVSLSFFDVHITPLGLKTNAFGGDHHEVFYTKISCIECTSARRATTHCKGYVAICIDLLFDLFIVTTWCRVTKVFRRIIIEWRAATKLKFLNTSIDAVASSTQYDALCFSLDTTFWSLSKFTWSGVMSQLASRNYCSIW